MMMTQHPLMMMQHPMVQQSMRMMITMKLKMVCSEELHSQDLEQHFLLSYFFYSLHLFLFVYCRWHGINIHFRSFLFLRISEIFQEFGFLVPGAEVEISINPIKKLSIFCPRHQGHQQCDQIGRNFATLAKNLSLYKCSLQNVELTFANIFMLG